MPTPLDLLAAPAVVTAVVCGTLGLLLGSFANVVVARVPEGRSVVRPRSACPACDAPIRAVDNVPVLSWLRLRGRCRDCAAPIPVRYPLVEAATAALLAAVALRVGPHAALPAYLLFAWTLLVVAVVDLGTHRIPNRLTYPLTPALGALLLLAALLDGTPGVDAAWRAAGGATTAFAGMLALKLASPGGIGWGDVKLAPFLGLGLGYLGWGHVGLGLFLAFALGGLVGSVLLLLRVKGRKDRVPFGPYLAVGALTAVLAGEPLLTAYRTLAGLG